MELVSRFFEPPKDSFFLFGPRGTGKSTLVRQSLPDAIYVDLLDPEIHRTLAARPERLRERLLAEPARGTVIIDEIQKIPELLDMIHSVIEEKSGWRFVLTGSSARKLRRGGVNLLAGRALLCSLHPFMPAELGENFSLNAAIESGLLPVVLDSDEPDRVLESYAALYLREEVQMEGVVRKIGDFSRFLEAVSFSHACPINLSSVARDCQVGRKTVESYVGVLEDLLISYRVPMFTRRAKRALSAHPKFYLFDAGVFRSLRPRGPLDRPEEIQGPALEGLVGQVLRAWIDYSRNGADLFFWRTRTGVEVDFVVYGPDGLFGIDVKNSRRIRPEHLRALRAFREDYPESETFLLYRGNERLVRDGTLCIPCEEFLLGLRPGDVIGGRGQHSTG